MVIYDEFTISNATTHIDSGADMNCIQKGLVPTQYFKKITQTLSNVSGKKYKNKI